MTHSEIRKKFLEFFEKREHKIVPSSSLIPDDPSVLFTTAGMQQFKKYYLDSPSPYGNRVASIQKCIRTTDIDEVGDESHLTFFEMLGNFSFKFPESEDSYFKEEAIKLGYDFIIGELKIPLARIKISVFGGAQENNIPADTESLEVWKKMGIPEDKIFFGEGKDNFWGPTGDEGPCGPTTEIYADGVEVWNIVFNEYYCSPRSPQGEAGALGKRLTLLERKGVDTGMGLERLAMVVQGRKNVFETDLFQPLILVLPTADTNIKRKRIIVDHARASFFLISDGVKPANKDRGYILRRLTRRMIVQAHLETFGSFSGTDTLSMGVIADIKRVFEKIYQTYSSFYPELNLGLVNEVFDKEFNQFNKTFRQGLKEIKFTDNITAPVAFNLYGTFGITFEIIKDIGGDKAKSLTREDFEREIEKHQEKSRAGAGKKFGLK